MYNWKHFRLYFLIFSLDNCVRQEKGYCRITWQQNSATTPDSFQLDTDASAAGTAQNGPACVLAYVTIPDSSLDGVTGIDPGLSPAATFYNRYCGIALGPTGATTATAMTCKYTVKLPRQLQPGPLSLVEECRGLALIGRENHSVEIFSKCCYASSLMP